MPAWTANSFWNDHLPHRIKVLHGFRDRQNDDETDGHRAMKDGAMVTCRVLWNILGVNCNSRNEQTPDTPSGQTVFDFELKGLVRLPAGVSVTLISETEFYALPYASDVRLVLIAANKCVAHLDQYPDHGVTYPSILDQAIDTTLAEIEQRLS